MEIPELNGFKSLLSDTNEGYNDSYGHRTQSYIEDYIQVRCDPLTFGWFLEIYFLQFLIVKIWRLYLCFHLRVKFLMFPGSLDVMNYQQIIQRFKRF